MSRLKVFGAIATVFCGIVGWNSTSLAGEPVNIERNVPSVKVETPTGVVEIKRNPDNNAEIASDFAKTSRACPPFCIQPMTPAEGVTTIGELELLAMLQDTGAMVIDSRTSKWYVEATIPGAVHLSYEIISERLDQLGCEADFDGWDCENAKKVALFCNGPWCGQSPTAIRAMVAAGFPAEKIYYYRGGMQNWQGLGLTVVKGE